MENEVIIESEVGVANVSSARVPVKKVRAAKGELVRKALEAGTGAPIAFSTNKTELNEIVAASQKVGAKTPHLFAKQVTLEKAKAINAEAVVNG